MAMTVNILMLVDWNGDGQFLHPESDITNKLRGSVTFTRGRKADGQTLPTALPGAMNFNLSNKDGLYSPFNRRSSLQSKVKPGLRCKFLMSDDGRFFEQWFTGTIFSIAPSGRSGTGELPTVAVGVQGIIGRLANAEIRLDPIVGTVSPYSVINQVLDEAGIGQDERDIRPLAYWGQQDVYPLYEGNALERLKHMEAATLGTLYESTDGKVVMDTAVDRINNLSNTVMSDSLASNTLPIYGAATSYENATRVNEYRGTYKIYARDTGAKRLTAPPARGYPIYLRPNVPVTVPLVIDTSITPDGEDLGGELALAERWTGYTHRAFQRWDGVNRAGAGPEVSSDVSRAVKTTTYGVDVTLTYTGTLNNVAVTELFATGLGVYLYQDVPLIEDESVGDVAKPFPYQYLKSSLAANPSVAVSGVYPTATFDFQRWVSNIQSRYGTPVPVLTVETGISRLADYQRLYNLDVGDSVFVDTRSKSNVHTFARFFIEQFAFTVEPHGGRGVVRCSIDLTPYDWEAEPNLFAPDGPALVNLQNPTETTVMATWDESVGAESYQNRVRPTDGLWTAWEPTGLQRTVLRENLVPSSDYVFEVRALNEFGPGSPSTASFSTLGISVQPGVPGAVPGVFTSGLAQTSLTARWSAATGNPTGYRIRYRVVNGSWNETVNLSSATLNYNFTGLTAGTQYEVEVWAYNAVGDGPRTKVRVSTASAITRVETVPGAVPNLRVTAFSNTSLTFEFGAPTGAVDRYERRFKRTADSVFSPWGAAGSPHNATGLTPSTDYDFEFRAVNVRGDGEATPISARTRTTPVPQVPGRIQVLRETSSTYRSRTDSARINNKPFSTFSYYDNVEDRQRSEEFKNNWHYTSTLSWTVPTGSPTHYEYRYRYLSEVGTRIVRVRPASGTNASLITDFTEWETVNATSVTINFDNAVDYEFTSRTFVATRAIEVEVRAVNGDGDGDAQRIILMPHGIYDFPNYTGAFVQYRGATGAARYAVKSPLNVSTITDSSAILTMPYNAAYRSTSSYRHSRFDIDDFGDYHRLTVDVGGRPLTVLAFDTVSTSAGASALQSGLSESTTYYRHYASYSASSSFRIQGQAALTFDTISSTPDLGPVPSEPRNITASNVVRASYRISWDAPATGAPFLEYEYRTRPEGGSWSVWNSTGTVRHYDFQNAIAGNTYQNQVRARNAAGRGSPASFTVTTDEEDEPLAQVPGQVAGLVPSGSTAGAVTFTWDAEPSATAYEYRYSIDDGVKTQWVRQASRVAALSGIHGTRIEFEVRAVNAHGHGLATTAAVNIPPSPVAAPSAPARIDVVSRGETNLRVTCGESTGNVAEYQYRWVEDGGVWSAWTPDADRDVTLTNLSPDTSYTIEWRASGAGGHGPALSVSARTRGTAISLATPRPSVDRITTTTAVVSWLAIAGATHYEISVNRGERTRVDGTTHTLSGLSPGTAYSVRVYAVAGNAVSDDGLTAFRTLESVDFSGFGFTHSLVQDGYLLEIDFTYAGAADAVDYRVYQQGTLAGEYTRTTNPSADVDDLNHGVTYVIDVRPVRTSDGHTGTPVTETVVPSWNLPAPDAVLVTKPNVQNLELTIDNADYPPGFKPTRYRVNVRKSSSNAFADVTVSGAQTRLSTTALASAFSHGAGDTIHVKVAVGDATRVSEFTSEVSFTQTFATAGRRITGVPSVSGFTDMAVSGNEIYLDAGLSQGLRVHRYNGSTWFANAGFASGTREASGNPRTHHSQSSIRTRIYTVGDDDYWLNAHAFDRDGASWLVRGEEVRLETNNRFVPLGTHRWLHLGNPGQERQGVGNVSGIRSLTTSGNFGFILDSTSSNNKVRHFATSAVGTASYSTITMSPSTGSLGSALYGVAANSTHFFVLDSSGRIWRGVLPSSASNRTVSMTLFYSTGIRAPYAIAASNSTVYVYDALEDEIEVLTIT